MMNNQEKIKAVIADFLKVSPSGIDEHTAIDRSAISNSILIHRMYARLAEEGFTVKNRSEIKTFGQLLVALNIAENGNNASMATNILPKPSLKTKQIGKVQLEKPALCGNVSIGIDIEDIENFPVADDYRQVQFYKDNFSSREISYCILQPKPLQSFAGKFAAKEAIIKANPLFKDKPLNHIEIMNDEGGRPVFQQFVLSISHARKQAIAIAIDAANPYSETDDEQSPVVKKETDAGEMVHSESVQELMSQQKTKSGRFLSILAILLSLAAIGLVMWEKLF